MKFLSDFFPILLFFAAYKYYGIFTATAVAITVSLLQVAWQWFRHHHVEKMSLVTMGLITVLGGATLLFHNPIFVMWKPTIVYWLFATIFIGSLFVGEKPLTERMMSHVVEAPQNVWRRLTIAWGSFFILLGVANIMVANRYFVAQRELDHAAGHGVEIANCADQLTGPLLQLCKNAKIMEDQWVDFKLFGLMGLMALFVIAQAFYLARYMRPAEEANEPENSGDQ